MCGEKLLCTLLINLIHSSLWNVKEISFVLSGMISMQLDTGVQSPQMNEEQVLPQMRAAGGRTGQMLLLLSVNPSEMWQ